MALTLAYRIQTSNDGVVWDDRVQIRRDSPTIDVFGLAHRLAGDFVQVGEPQTRLIDELTGVVLVKVDKL